MELGICSHLITVRIAQRQNEKLFEGNGRNRYPMGERIMDISN